MPEFNPELPETPECNGGGLADDSIERPNDIWQEAQGTWRRATTLVAREIEERPMRTVLLSLGAGYLLGGGLFTPLTGRLVGAGLRMGLRALAVPALASGALAIGKQLLGEDAERSAKLD